MKECSPHTIGTSDPLAYTCTCPASTSPTGGLVLLFYRYWGNSPLLPASYLSKTSELPVLESWHHSLTQKYKLKGKIRIAKEGFNITVGGTTEAVNAYIKECSSHWTFSGLPLGNQSECNAFFKPTPGCSCVFPATSIKICSEITPMGVTNYIPSSWGTITALSPSDFHSRCHESSSALLLDVRNHYESRIGYFIDPRTGKAALRPPIRRFSQFPQYVKSHLSELFGQGLGEGGQRGEGERREILSYCTGGIRCEKGVRFLYDQLAPSFETVDPPKIYTLEGGIAAYLTWMDSEIAAGRKMAAESLFKGKNYVFDARGSMGLGSGLEEEVEKVAACHGCGKTEDRMAKCRSTGCHLVLVVCVECEECCGVTCCTDCGRMDEKEDGKWDGRRKICDCEREREEVLWGKKEKTARGQGWRKKERKKKSLEMDIQIKVID